MLLLNPPRRIANWLMSITPGEPEAIRDARIGSMFQRRPALVMSSLAILLVSVTTAAMTSAGWAFAWVAADVVLLGARFALSLRHDRPGSDPGLPAMRLIAFGSCLIFILLGAGCSAAMATGIPTLMVMSAISILGLVNGITSLWAGVPRLAFAMLTITTIPFALSMAFGAGIPLVALQFLILTLGTTAFILQNNRRLLSTLHADHRNRLLAGTDQLTGLKSRGALLERLQQLCAGRTAFALLYLDLDGFKPVNDTFGHTIGDQLLREQARRIAALPVRFDVASRFGGDEFILILTNADAAIATVTAGQLIRAIEAPVALDGAEATVSASIGIALSPADATEPDALIGLADRALYTAKRAGKGTWCFASGTPGDRQPSLSGSTNRVG